MRIVQNVVSVTETFMDVNILRNTEILPTGTHVLQCVSRTRIAITGPIVWKPGLEDEKYAIFMLIMTIRDRELASVDIILAHCAGILPQLLVQWTSNY